MVPNDVQSELKHLYVAVGELLRHFWSCFPVNTPFLEEKVRQSFLVWYWLWCGYGVSKSWFRMTDINSKYRTNTHALNQCSTYSPLELKVTKQCRTLVFSAILLLVKIILVAACLSPSLPSRCCKLASDRLVSSTPAAGFSLPV